MFNVWMVIGFQAVWFACAWGIAHQYPLLPILIGLVYLNTFMSKQTDKKSAYRYLAKVLLMGFVLDSLLGLLGWLSFKSPYPEPLNGLQPWWLSILWVSFGASIRYSFAWIKSPVLLGILGLIGGPLAYYGGQKLGAFVHVELVGYIVLALSYAALIPYLVKTLPKTSVPYNTIS
jgi:hypothetical protein